MAWHATPSSKRSPSCATSGSYVRAGADFVTAVVADAKTRIINRPAHTVEIAELELPENGWVTVIERGGEVEVLPADKVEIRGSGA
jgi:hypothetical protein